MFNLVVPSARSRRWPAALATTFAIAGTASASAVAAPGAVYTETNAAPNAVQKFDRAADGSLTPAGTFSTGGDGSSSPGGRQAAVALSEDRDTLYAVNSGSDSLSAFRVTRSGLALVATVPSPASRPSASTSMTAGSMSSIRATRRRAARPTWPSSQAGCAAGSSGSRVARMTWPPARSALPRSA